MSLQKLLPLASLCILAAGQVSAQSTSFNGQTPPSGGSAGGLQMVWEDISPSQLATNSPLSLAIQPGNADRIIVTTPLDGLCVTSNGGQTWSNIYLDFFIDDWTPSWWINDVAFRPGFPNEALAVTMSGTYWSDDSGSHWYSTSGQRPEGSFEVVTTADGTNAAAAGQSGDLWIYDWNTHTWPLRQDVAGATRLHNLDFDVNGWLYIAHLGTPVWTTNDLGATYQKFGRGLPGSTHDVLCDPQISGRAHIVSQTQLYVTNDGPSGASGGTWSPSGIGLPAGKEILCMIHHPAHPHIMFAGLSDKGAFVSHNRGATWSRIGVDGMTHTSVLDLAISEDDPTYLYAAAHSGSGGAGALYRLKIQE